MKWTVRKNGWWWLATNGTFECNYTSWETAYNHAYYYATHELSEVP